MSSIQRYEPGPTVIDAEIITIDLAPVEAKHQLAKRAWDSLPVGQQYPENLDLLKQAVTTDPKGFLELCRREGMQVDFDLVVNYHEENHHHYHQSSGGITREDLWAMAEAFRPQEPALTAADVLAIMQAHQPQQSYSPPPIYYPPPPPTHITFSPHIEVSSHSEQDNSGNGRGAFLIVVIWAVFMIAIVGGSASD